MDGFSEIFEAMVQDHARRPRNFGALENYTHEAEGVNPLTGDRLHIQMRVEEETVTDVKFTGSASSLATASASIMSDSLKGVTKAVAIGKISSTIEMISGETPVAEDLPEDEYSVLLEIRHFPHRVRCASLAWNTAEKALKVPTTL